MQAGRFFVNILIYGLILQNWLRIALNIGSTMIGYQPLADRPNFFRYVCANPAATKEDIDFLLNEIRRLGEAEDIKGSYNELPITK